MVLDGAPAHTANIMQAVMSRLGGGGHLPGHSPNLNLLDFIARHPLQLGCGSHGVPNLHVLRNRIRAEWTEMFTSENGSFFHSRRERIVAEEGGYIEAYHHNCQVIGETRSCKATAAKCRACFLFALSVHCFEFLCCSASLILIIQLTP